MRFHEEVPRIININKSELQFFCTICDRMSVFFIVPSYGERNPLELPNHECVPKFQSLSSTRLFCLGINGKLSKTPGSGTVRHNRSRLFRGRNAKVARILVIPGGISARDKQAAA